MQLISIDGACRRNGKPDCVSAGGVFVQRIRPGYVPETLTMSICEHSSTNQRGELSALYLALQYLQAHLVDAIIVTDSEYLFNAMTKKWYDNWANKGWLTATGEPVKNIDLWKNIASVIHEVELSSDVAFYHIKGHCISFGKVTATKLLDEDLSGKTLLRQVTNKFVDSASDKFGTFKAAQELSVKNNGYELPDDVFKRFVIANTMADAIATRAVEIADRER